MIKKFSAVIISALICVSMLLPVSAVSKHIIDMTGEVSSSGLDELEAMATKLETDYNCCVMYVLTSGIDKFTNTNDYAEDYYNKNASGDGIILVHDILNKKYSVYSTEDSIFTENDEEKIGNDYNSAATYSDGIKAYIEDAEDLLYVSSLGRTLDLLVDNADVLSEIEEQPLLAKLNMYSEALKCELAIVTVNNTEGKTAQEYADDFYDYNGYGYGDKDDGVLFLYSKDDNCWAVSTYGTGMILSTETIDNLVSGIGDYIRNGEYGNAFTKYTDDMFSLLNSFISEDYPDLSSAYGTYIENPELIYTPQKRNPIIWFVIVFAVAFVVAYLIMKAATANLKSVKAQTNANSYVVKNSFALTNQSDVFLYSNVVRTEIPKNTSSGGGSNDSHVSSSGRTHGGSSGHF